MSKSDFEFGQEALGYVAEKGNNIWKIWHFKYAVPDDNSSRSLFIAGFAEGYLTRVTQERENMLDGAPKDLMV